MTSKTARKMFKVFCNVHLCMFLYVYDLFHILLSCDKIMDPWNVCVCVCVCARVCARALVCVCARARACVCVGLSYRQSC
jgi:hypothetical protein